MALSHVNTELLFELWILRVRSYQQCVQHLCWRLHHLVPDPLALTMPCLSERHSNDDLDNTTSPQIEWVCFVAMFSGILLHSPSALVCGWDWVQNAEAFSLFPFLDAYFTKCHVHLLGQLYEGSPLPHPQHSTWATGCQGTSTHCEAWPPLAGAGTYVLGMRDVPSQTGLHSLPHSDANVFWFLEKKY